MAKVLQITDGTSTVDLLTGTFKLADAGWLAQQSDNPVWETFTCFAQGTDAAIRTEQDKLDKLSEVAYNYVKDILEKTPVYLRVQSEGETVRRAVVLNIAVSYGADSNISALLGANMVSSQTGTLVTIAVYRTPYFEQESANVTSTTGLTANGGFWVPAGSGAGVIPQRISKFVVSSSTATSALYKMWIGIRRIRNGSANFKCLWECETGTMHIADTTTQADATASGSSKVQITYATSATLARRFTLVWQTGGGGGTTDDDILGEYLVLGRVKLSSASTEVRILLKHGWLGLSYDQEIAGDTYLSAVQDSNLTNWNLVELGRVKLPPTGNRDGIGEATADIAYVSLNIWSERMSASGNLDMDYILLVPTDHLLYLEQTYAWASGGKTNVYTSPLNEQIALSRVSEPSGAIVNTIGSYNNWYYPSGGGIVVVAAQEKTRHQLGFTLDVTLNLVPRYKLFKV